MQYINARQTTMVRLGKLLPYKRNKKKRRSRKKKKLLGGNSDSQSCVVDYFPIATCRVVFSFLLIHHDWHLRSLVFRVSRSPLFSGYLVLCTVFWCCIMVLEEPCCVHVHKQDNKNISDRLTAFHQNTPTQLFFFFFFPFSISRTFALARCFGFELRLYSPCCSHLSPLFSPDAHRAFASPPDEEK